MTAPSWGDLKDVLERLKAGGVAVGGELTIRWHSHVGDGRYEVGRHDGTCSLFKTPGEVVADLTPLGLREWVLDPEARA